MNNKEETQLVLVECVSTFRQRYMVEVPVGTDDYGNDKTLWALDTVTMQEAKEFSQEYLGEQIVSHRVVTYDEALSLCDKDNDYVVSWDIETKVKKFFTTLVGTQGGAQIILTCIKVLVWKDSFKCGHSSRNA